MRGLRAVWRQYPHRAAPRHAKSTWSAFSNGSEGAQPRLTQATPSSHQPQQGVLDSNNFSHVAGLSREVFPESLSGMVSGMNSSLREGLVAHRGYHCPRFVGARPMEGTLPAYASAWTAGMKFCECDVRLTVDKQLVLSHDSNLEKVAVDSKLGTAAKISECTFDELKEVPLRDGHQLALLKDALSMGRAMGGRMIIEIKPGRGVGEAVAELFHGAPALMESCEVVMSFELAPLEAFLEEWKLSRTLRAAQASQPFSMMLTVAEPSGDPEYTDIEQVLDLGHGDWQQAVSKWRSLGLDGVYAEWTADLAEAHAGELQRLVQLCRAVGVWQNYGQPDSEPEAQRLLSLGAQYVNTDLPSDFSSSS